MSTTLTQPPAADQAILELGPDSNGIELSPHEFDTAEFEEGYRYELINGVLIVNPPPLIQERGPNDRLGHRIISYQETLPKGQIYTVPEQTIEIGKKRRRADRVIWIGLGRAPKENETPTIAIELVSKGKRSARRDYGIKRKDYQSVKIQEYWVIDRFKRTMTVFKLDGSEVVLKEDGTYATDLMPGFKLPLKELFDEIDWLGSTS